MSDAAAQRSRKLSARISCTRRTIRCTRARWTRCARHSQPSGARRDAIDAQRHRDRLSLDGRAVSSTSRANVGQRLPWLFYKDGIREFAITKGFEGDELLILFSTLCSGRALAVDEDDDLLTLLLGARLRVTCTYAVHRRRACVGGMRRSLRPEPRAGTIDKIDWRPMRSRPKRSFSPLRRHEDRTISTRRCTSSTITEIAYLRDSIRAQNSTADLRPSSSRRCSTRTSTETDPTVREEIAGILDGLFLLLLLARTSSGLPRISFAKHAITAGRAAEILLGTAAASAALVGSAQRARKCFAQLLDALEETPLRPPQTDLQALLRAAPGRRARDSFFHGLSTSQKCRAARAARSCGDATRGGAHGGAARAHRVRR